MSATATRSTLAERYIAAFPQSQARYAQARTIFPAGVTHDVRMMDPFPIYVERAKGSQKWDVDGHAIIDYFVGHGALLLGHSPDDVVAAVQEQMAKGTHYGSCHDLEIGWGERVQQLVPCAERVRFTSSGTEATLMALRLCRIVTGKPKFLKFLGHFHGWHDYVAIAADAPYDGTGVPGVPDAVAGVCVSVPPNDLNRVEETLKNDPAIGCVILEPTGGHWGTVPIRGEFLRGLRDICTRLGRILIFDEVITGFRVAPGGAQQYYGVTPDLTSLAKILAGGLPGGCLAGREEIMSYLEPRPGRVKMKHPGTYNGNPLSAAAGIAVLDRVATGEPTRAANASAQQLRNRLNAMFAANNWPWVAYGDFSMIKVLPNYQGPRPDPNAGVNDGLIPLNGDLNVLDGASSARLTTAVRQGMLLNGVDWWKLAGMTSSAHTAADIAQTVTAMENTVGAILREGIM
ncbi:MAG: aminotransferase class III-fold pyridoxal phosphate-dependent enzyme [Bacteroidales bacterium]|nr:aminotransferase class III-fold pyridoxal phosphate-dependent enzyme [Bacteroidales bacterium]